MITPIAPTMTPREFIDKWESVYSKESQGAQGWFLDLLRVVGCPDPFTHNDLENFTFEKPVPGGFADAYLADCFAWEFKAWESRLPQGLNQLLRYQVHLKTPPLLIVSSFRTIRLQTNFRGKETRVWEIPVERLDLPRHLTMLRNAFFDPGAFEPDLTPEEITRDAARLFGGVAEDMEDEGVDKERIAKYLNRIVFCLYAEGTGLLPDRAFSQIVEKLFQDPRHFNAAMPRLFAEMKDGGMFGADIIAHFNGDLFNDLEDSEGENAVYLSVATLYKLYEAIGYSWRNVAPSIFGSLFEAALDRRRRAALGAHYTDPDDIMLVVDPVIMQPLRREWDAVRDSAQRLKDAGKTDESAAAIDAFRDRLTRAVVLDPACGSGNFLYIALRALLDLEKEAMDFAAGIAPRGPKQGIDAPRVNPSQMRGLELDHYAAELARTALWIGYIQWHLANGFTYDRRPVLTPLSQVRQADAVLTYNPDGSPAEPDWPDAEFIVSNPPFLGRRSWNASIDREYINAIDKVYRNRVARSSDLCCYWFEKARAMIEQGKTRRAGLLATQNIRAVFSRGVLDRINETGSIFMAHSDKNWLLQGANVHVSIIGFDDGSETEKTLNGERVDRINSNLTAGVDVTTAQRLTENAGIAFRGPGTSPFDIPPALARNFLGRYGNPNRRPNSDVVFPVRNGLDLSSSPRGYYTINFGDMPLDEAAQYEAPFEYARSAAAAQGRDMTGNYWQFSQSAQSMNAAIQGLARFIAHSVTAKHLTFVWVDAGVICNNATNVFASDDDYIFGVLHSRIHEIWARALGTQLRERESAFRYTPTTCFETFPFPAPDAAQRAAVAAAAKRLDELRRNWLSASEGEDMMGNPVPANRTLTGLYNAAPTWLRRAHAALDAATAAAYAWPPDADAPAILERLLALNLQRAANQ